MVTERFDFNATTYEAAEEYILGRARQLLAHNVFIQGMQRTDAGVIALFNGIGTSYQAFYVLSQHRGKGHFQRTIQQNGSPIITLESCKLERWLVENNIPHVCLRSYDSWYEYFTISQFYKADRASRSGVHFMNHIDEGMAVLHWIGASAEAKKAYCLHPIFQTDAALTVHGDVSKGQFWRHCDPNAIMMAMEYRSVANEYLSPRKLTSLDDIRLSPLKEVNDMLIADKVQNRKDFELYHKETHPRSQELSRYFDLWLERLGITEGQYQKFKTLLTTPDRAKSNS